MKILILSFAMMILSSIALADDPQAPKDCVTVETKDGYTLLTNKCGVAVNVTWIDADSCKVGCTKKLAGRGYQYEVLFKDPYVISACFSPEQVDPNWKGVGVASCK